MISKLKELMNKITKAGLLHFVRNDNTRKKVAFTLAEVLITLGIIGVVAAMTIPTLVRNYQEKVYVNQLKESYAILKQVFLLAQNDYGSIESWDWGTMGCVECSNRIMNMLLPYFKNPEVLDSSDSYARIGCYKALFSGSCDADGTIKDLFSTNQIFRIQNGAVLFLWSAGKTNGKCSNYGGTCGLLSVDVNGAKGPNIIGVDGFRFDVTPKGIFPTDYVAEDGPYDWTCKYNDKSDRNGAGCAAWVIAKGNMDYRRRDVREEWKKHIGK